MKKLFACLLMLILCGAFPCGCQLHENETLEGTVHTEKQSVEEGTELIEEKPMEPEASGIEVELSMLHSSASAFLEKCKYNGINYLSDWESNCFTSDNSIYDLALTGEEKNYYIYDAYMTITTRDDTIVGVSEGGLQTLFDNTYQLLQWLGGEEAKLLDYEPELIYDPNGGGVVYLKWETQNGYMVIKTSWSQWTENWKESRPWTYCAYIK